MRTLEEIREVALDPVFDTRRLVYDMAAHLIDLRDRLAKLERIEVEKWPHRIEAPAPLRLKSVEELANEIGEENPNRFPACLPCRASGIRTAREEIAKLCEAMMQKRAPGEWHDGFETCCKVIITEIREAK